MAGNEKEITSFLIRNLNHINLQHLGEVHEVGLPNNTTQRYTVINEIERLDELATEDAKKKADIYINGCGISLKQSGSSFSFNRLQRANIEDVFLRLGFDQIQDRLEHIDREVDEFHRGMLECRNRPWQNFFNEHGFRELLRYLMMVGSPNNGDSSHLAEYILDAPTPLNHATDIHVYNFEEYFNTYRNNFKIAIRRQWIGQLSKSEHSRAVGLARKVGNAPWVYNGAVGEPKTGWRADFPANSRKTVYFLMIEKVR